MQLEYNSLYHWPKILIRCSTDIDSPLMRLGPNQVQDIRIYIHLTAQKPNIVQHINEDWTEIYNSLLASLSSKIKCYRSINYRDTDLNILQPLGCALRIVRTFREKKTQSK